MLSVRDDGYRVVVGEGAEVCVTEKGDKSRVVYLTWVSADALLRYVRVRCRLFPSRHDFLFLTDGGLRLSYFGARSILHRLSLLAGVLDVRHNAHAFRHAFARDTISNGADLSQVSAMMGHSSPRVTGEFYAVWLPSELAEVHHRVSPVS